MTRSLPLSLFADVKAAQDARQTQAAENGSFMLVVDIVFLLTEAAMVIELPA